MIAGGMAFVIAAYALTLATCGTAALIVTLRLRYWARLARALEKAKP